MKKFSIEIGMLFSLILLFAMCHHDQVHADDIRSPAVAGQFYPASRAELIIQIQGFVNKSKPMTVNGDIVGIWVPHAGYIFSGQVAGNAYACVQDKKYDLIVLIGASHHIRLKGGSIGNWSHYKTPLGLASIDVTLASQIRKDSDLVECVPVAHTYEHSLEVQIPFLQVVQPGVPVLPLIIDADLSFREAQSVARTLVERVKDKQVLFVASSDMSHYPTYKDAYEVDLKMLDAIATFDPKNVLKRNMEILEQNVPNLACVLCGKSAVITMMLASKLMGADETEILPYMNSGDISGERHRVVGYGSALFVNNQKMKKAKGGQVLNEIAFSEDEKEQLFRIARESILQALKDKKPPRFNIKNNNLLEKRGVFITLTNEGRLRGCIGHFDTDYPLYQIVTQMSIAAATQDYRFMYNPITSDEMEDIEIKISILSPLKKIDSIDEIKIGQHGIWIRQGSRGGTYLPEVATEMGWNKIEFLEHCCAEKAGLSPDAWKNDAEIYIYSSQILSEKDL